MDAQSQCAIKGELHDLVDAVSPCDVTTAANDRKTGRNVSIGVMILVILLKTLIPVLRK